MGSKEYEQHKPEFCCKVVCLMGKMDAIVTSESWVLFLPSGLKWIANTREKEKSKPVHHYANLTGRPLVHPHRG